MVKRLRAGVVWANTFNRFDPTVPFGGYKESGFGREGGVHGLLPYLDLGTLLMAPTSRAVTQLGAAPAPRRASPCARPTSCTWAASSRAPSRDARTSSGQRTARRSPTRSRGSRKDLRDAVRSARGAFPGWDGKTAMNRGQMLYRVAELLEGRRDQFEAEVAAAEGLTAAAAREQVDRSIDRWVWYAGWADKISPAAGHGEPGRRRRYFDFTHPGGDRRRGRRRARGVLAAGAGLAPRAGRRQRQRLRRARVGGPAAARGDPRRRCWPRRTCRAA